MRSRLVAGAAAALFLALAALSGRASMPLGEAPAARSKRGMVSAATRESVEAGARVLAEGGGAVDAAVSAAFVLAVTYPQAGNLAGGGFAVVRTAEGGFFALDFRETAPAATWRNTYLDAGGASRPQASRYGGLAVATPGTVRGLEALHRKFGRLPWGRTRNGARPRSPAQKVWPPALGPARRARDRARAGRVSRPSRPRSRARRRACPARPVSRSPGRSPFLSTGRTRRGGNASRATGSRGDTRGDRLAGCGRIPPRRGRPQDRGVRPRDRRSPHGGGPRRLRAVMADPVRVRLRPLSARDDAASLGGRLPSRVHPRAASIRARGHLVPRFGGGHPPDRRSRAPRIRRPEPLSRRPRLRGHAAGAAPRARPPRRTRLLDRPRAGHAVAGDAGRRVARRARSDDAPLQRDGGRRRRVGRTAAPCR